MERKHRRGNTGCVLYALTTVLNRYGLCLIVEGDSEEKLATYLDKENGGQQPHAVKCYYFRDCFVLFARSDGKTSTLSCVLLT